jgi:DNA-binding NtrC family response regulator
MSQVKPLILVVDDHPDVRQICKITLELNGFKPVLAEDGNQGLEIFREIHPELSLAVVDVTMPVMGGIELVEHMFDLQPQSKVIMMTGYSPKEFIRDYLKKLCAFLQKPFRPQEFITAVKKCLKYDEQGKLRA